MRWKRVCTILLALLTICIAIGASRNWKLQYLSYTKDEQDAYEQMLRTMSFSNAGVGYGGTIPEEIHAFDVLCKSKHAAKYFKMLETNASQGGKAYALCGLYLTDKKAFDDLSIKYLNDTEDVNDLYYIQGCLEWKSSIKQIIMNVNMHCQMLKQSTEIYELKRTRFLNSQ